MRLGKRTARCIPITKICWVHFWKCWNAILPCFQSGRLVLGKQVCIANYHSKEFPFSSRSSPIQPIFRSAATNPETNPSILGNPEDTLFQISLEESIQSSQGVDQGSGVLLARRVSQRPWLTPWRRLNALLSLNNKICPLSKKLYKYQHHWVKHGNKR